MSDQLKRAEGVQSLFKAANEYHMKRSRPGGAAMCVCGAGGGGSKACSGLAIVRDFFRYAEWGDEKNREMFDELKRNFG